ncbi:serine/threonine-protein kinase [Nonomuraea turcica]|uniref:serine/threonine-protein kinase n=1 Tax=Nonomuraea sp. G32 TaxID=3067274 RepID=UPI00273C2FF3|nr:serine/threonine-protein kinase [Nonomuraea sp. G32]MDP4500557.1 serine/threonine-protein kinase [Nonomuraea sp. G32]
MVEDRVPEGIGDYRVVARLGEGGQGSVFLGESPDGQRVAIKMLHARYAADADTRRRFLREAEVAARVAAFCTARVIGTGLVAERPYIVSEYVPGPSLDELVKRDGPRTGSGLERLAVSTLTALASIHSAGIVHRDFKPSNVILGPEGPVVIDFGIARAIDHVTSNTSLLGTPAYMSPEQLSAETLTPASDMFSWAGTMVFAASGRIPFSGAVVPAILHAILHAEPEVSAVPGPLRPLVLACLAKDPTARPAAAHVLRDLTGRANTSGYDNRVAPAGGAGRPTPTIQLQGRHDTDPVAPPQGHRAPRRRTPWIKITIAVAVSAAAVTAGVVFSPSLLGGPVTAEPSKSQTQQAQAPLPPVLDLAAFPKVDGFDEFAGDTSGRYTVYQPFPDEQKPEISVGGGRFSGSGSAPFFALVAGPSAPSSGRAVSIVTVGGLAGSGETEDSLFAGWVKDRSNYVTVWYNNTRQTSGIDVRLNGEFVHVPNEIPLRLSPGDRLALEMTDQSVTAYAEQADTWQRLHSIAIPLLFTTGQERQRYHYGFGLRGTTGTISVTGTEGRSAAQG